MNNTKKQRRTIEWERLGSFFKKIGDIKGTFLTRMGMKKDRDYKNLTEAEEIKKRW